MRVAVPLDGVSAYLVSNPSRTITAHVERERLQIDAPKCTFATLNEAFGAAISALSALSITPIRAVGCNANFSSEEVLEQFVSMTECSIDKRFSECGFKIEGRTVTRSLSLPKGRLNLSLAKQGNVYSVNMHFHFDTSEVDKATEWLQTTRGAVPEHVKRVASMLSISLEEAGSEPMHWFGPNPRHNDERFVETLK